MTYGVVSFVGGIHGVGKTTICKTICEHTGLHYLSASELIKWSEINIDKQNKNVRNIPSTQERLLSGLSNAAQNGLEYLLDGHFCLLDISNQIVKIPYRVFEKVSPNCLILVTGEICKIKENLESRDKRSYDFALLEKMQCVESEYALELSLKLNVPLIRCNENDVVKTIASVKEVRGH